MPNTLDGLSPKGKRLEAAALLRSVRDRVSAAYDSLDDLNTVEADELARVVTELRLAARRIDEDAPYSAYGGGRA